MYQGYQGKALTLRAPESSPLKSSGANFYARHDAIRKQGINDSTTFTQKRKPFFSSLFPSWQKYTFKQGRETY